MARAARTPAPFHGAMLNTTPAGWRTVIDSVPGLSVGRVSPWICVARPAASRKSWAVRKTLKPAQSWAAPTSDIIVSMNSGPRRSMMSAAFSMTARRSLGPVADQLAKAFEADSTASMASSTLAAALSVTRSPVSGFRRSKVLPSRLPRASLSMMSCVCIGASVASPRARRVAESCNIILTQRNSLLHLASAPGSDRPRPGCRQSGIASRTRSRVPASTRSCASAPVERQRRADRR